MKFTQTVKLLGVVGKKGSGKLDNGNSWETDRVELHCLSDFPESDAMAHGQTCAVYQVQDYNQHYDNAKSLVGKNIELHMFMEPAKKLGQPPRMKCEGFTLPHGEAPRSQPQPKAG